MRASQRRLIVIKMQFNPVIALGLGLLLACAREERAAQIPKASLVDPSAASSSRTALSASAGPSGALPSASPSAPTPAPAGSDPSLAFTPPATLKVPAKLRPDERLPLLVILHGYGVPGALLVVKARLQELADEKRFGYLVPDGNRDSANRPFWNVGPSCCSIDAASVDDVGRLSALIESVSRDPRIDPNRVFLIGYSNGGFMAHRLACAIGDRVAAVISVSGAAPGPAEACKPGASLSIVEIHGDVDPIVRYSGGRVFDRADFAEHPSALSSMQGWAQRLGCSGEPRRLESRDLEPNLKGAETEVLGFGGCRGAVELWTVRGGAHYVALEPPAVEAMWSFLKSHPKNSKEHRHAL